MKGYCLIGVGTLVASLGCSIRTTAQYFAYSQYNFTEQRVNPAMTGRTRYASASVDFRDQKTGGDFSIRSNFLELAYPLLNSSTGQPWSGFGISFHDDRSGGIFHTREAAVSYAVHVRVGRRQTLSMGVKVLGASREVDFSGFHTGSQYVPDRGFDEAAANGEQFYGYRNTFTTFSSGLYWEETDRKGRRRHHLGFSFFDMNRPDDSFIHNGGQLPSTFIVEGGFEAFTANQIHFFPEALVTHSAATTLVNAGFRIQKELNVTPRALSDRLELIAKYAVGRSGILGVQLHLENFSVGLSYDFPLFAANAGNLGALEAGVTVRRLVSTNAQRNAARRKKAADKMKSTLSKNRPAKATDAVVDRKVTKDTLTTFTPSEVAPAPPTVYADASAGPLNQEPVAVETVTLHFSFAFNSTDLDAETEEYLDVLVATLEKEDQLTVLITGHTDNVGGEKFNLRLSQKRADAVKSYLMKRGIAAGRIHSEGKGMSQPMNDNLTDEERAMNRRVEIVLLGKVGGK